MSRANRYYLSGHHVWHLTHRCHKREFLLKFARDRRCWEYWLFEARKRFGLCVLNYVATCNHVHLLVYDGDDSRTIPRAMQLLAGRTAQAYNQRKRRSGAFWEDRYHATAVENGQHLARCLIYINLNMVRAGAVTHPAEWAHGGYHEIDQPPGRYARIDRICLARLLELSTIDELSEWQRRVVADALIKKDMVRSPEWSDGIAVGSTGFVARVAEQLGVRARFRTVETAPSGAYILRERHVSYNADTASKNKGLSLENTCLWNVDC